MGARGGAHLIAATWLYFAYGSNMSTARLTGRTPSARPLGRARLARHVLRWDKPGRDGSGKCAIWFDGPDSDAAVWGVLFEIDAADKPALDRVEGLGVGYMEVEVRVETSEGPRTALSYYPVAEKLDPALRPHGWYRSHVLRGAREHGLPADYVRMIEGTPTAADP